MRSSGKSRLVRSPAEIADRLRQEAFKLIGRMSAVRQVRPAKIAPAEPLMPFSKPSAEELQAIRTLYPEHETDVLHRADAIVAGRFELLGYGEVDAGNPIDWDRDPISGRRAPAGHWSTIPYLDFSIVGDHKVTWELNRHQWLITLAQAWCLTGREQYSRCAAATMVSWSSSNPAGQGINWVSSLELALRAISWIWALHLLRDAPRPDTDERRHAAGVLREHGLQIERHLSTYFSPNTHLTGEALGLLYIGVALPSLPESERWASKGLAILCREAACQIRPDGTYFEQTAWYQGYTVDFLLHALRFASKAGMAVPADLRRRAEAAAIALLNVLRPDGEVVRIGDDDGGRLCGLDVPRAADHRVTIGLSALEFGWKELPEVASEPPPSLAWLVGLRDVQQLRKRPIQGPLPSRAFPDGGLYRLADPEGSWMLVDAGPHGALTGAHAHADPTTFELALDRRMFIVDSGTGRYVGGEREAFRSSLAHNVLNVEGRSSGATSGAFRWSRAANTRVRCWRTGREGDYLEVEHDGYESATVAVRHCRRFLRLASVWIVVDEWNADSPVKVESRLHVASDLGVDRSTGRSAYFKACSAATPFAVAADCDFEILPTIISPLYGKFVPTSVVCLRPPACTSGYLLMALAHGFNAARVSRISSDDHSPAWEICVGDEPGVLSLGAADEWRDLSAFQIMGPIAWLPQLNGAQPVLPAGGRWRFRAEPSSPQRDVK